MLTRCKNVIHGDFVEAEKISARRVEQTTAVAHCWLSVYTHSLDFVHEKLSKFVGSDVGRRLKCFPVSFI